MKLALFGYGKMGRMVEQAAEQQDIEVVAIFDPVSGSQGVSATPRCASTSRSRAR
jgi:glyceraldehyde-3-phosphate dehydrogenase/erythrose-4-phosphate dehydrogenase